MGENVLIIDSLPAGEVICPPYKLTPYKEGDNGFEKLCVVFEEDFDGDLSIKIFSLMAEDFRVWIDGEEYSYAVRGSKQTDPGYAMLAGPFEKGTVIGAAWGKESAGVYMQEDVETAGQPETVEEEQGRTVRIPFSVTGARSVLFGRTLQIVLVEISPDSAVTLLPHKGFRLLVSGTPLEGEKVLPTPSDVVYSELEVDALEASDAAGESAQTGEAGQKKTLTGVVGQEKTLTGVAGQKKTLTGVAGQELSAGVGKYRIVLKNPLAMKDKEQGPDAFMNVTGSFAGELCYRIGESEDRSEGTYQTLESHDFGIDPFTGYYWGRMTEDGSEWAFQLEEGLYGINVSVGSGTEVVVLVTDGKEKEYKLPPMASTFDGPTAMTIRARVKNGIVTLRCRGSEGTACPFEGIEIRTLSTTAHASDYIPADMSEDPEEVPAEIAEETPSEDPEEAPVEIAEETPSEVQEEIFEEKAEEMPAEVQEGISEEKAEEMPAEVQEEISEEKAEEMPAEVQEEVPEEKAEEMPAEVQEEIPEEKAEEMPEEVQEEISEEKAEEMPAEVQEEVPEEKEEVTAETKEETPAESREQDVVSVQEKQPAVRTGAEKPRKEYSVDRSLELTEKEYRSAIENYFGPTSHGIDFWDSERKERPEKAPAPEPKPEPIHEPKQEVPAEPESKPEVAAEPEVIPEIELEVAAEPEVIPEIEPEAAAEPEVIPEIEPEVAAEPEVIPEIEPEVAAEPEAVPEIEPEVAAEPEVIPEIEPEVAAEPAKEPVEKPAEEPANKIRVSVYSGSSRKQTSKYTSKDKTSGGLSGLFSVFGRKKR
jgi:hypothetical protein